MAFIEEAPQKPSRGHEIGQDLAALSVGELNSRIALLRDEIVRIEAELAAKGSTKAAAEALFRR